MTNDVERPSASLPFMIVETSTQIVCPIFNRIASFILSLSLNAYFYH